MVLRPHPFDGHGPIRILGIAGSLRARSFNRALLRVAADLAPVGMTIEIFDRVGELPLYNPDLDGARAPESVRTLRDAVHAADGLLIATPEYNYSIPAPLKNLVDWASRPANASSLTGKPLSIIGAATGLVGTARAQMALRQCFVFTRSLPLTGPEVLVSKAKEKFDDQLRLVHQETRDFLAQHLVALRDWVRRLGGDRRVVEVAPLAVPAPRR